MNLSVSMTKKAKSLPSDKNYIIIFAFISRSHLTFILELVGQYPIPNFSIRKELFARPCIQKRHMSLWCVTSMHPRRLLLLTTLQLQTMPGNPNVVSVKKNGKILSVTALQILKRLKINPGVNIALEKTPADRKRIWTWSHERISRRQNEMILER